MLFQIAASAVVHAQADVLQEQSLRAMHIMKSTRTLAFHAEHVKLLVL